MATLILLVQLYVLHLVDTIIGLGVCPEECSCEGSTARPRVYCTSSGLNQLPGDLTALTTQL